MKPDFYDSEVQWSVAQDNRARHPRYIHSCHQCGTVVVTFSSGVRAARNERRTHEVKHRTMAAIQEAEAEMGDVA